MSHMLIFLHGVISSVKLPNAAPISINCGWNISKDNLYHNSQPRGRQFEGIIYRDLQKDVMIASRCAS
jgi:hypothetical protein